MGNLFFEKEKFYFEAGSSKERLLAQKAKLQFDADTLRWVTRNAAKARVLRRFADQSAELKFKNTFITEFAPPESIQFPDNQLPRSWQVKSAWHCVTRSPAYCADEAGLGKTPMSIMCLNSVPGKALIICPAFLKYNWEKEITEWCVRNFTNHTVIETRNDGAEKFEKDIVVLPDSLITDHKIQEKLFKHRFEWLFIDEFHRFKTSDTQRTLALIGDENGKGITDIANRVIFLSGTPNPNGRPIELYHQLSRLAPEAIGFSGPIEYGRKFCAGKKVTRFEGRKAVTHWDFQGASNLGILNQLLQNKLMIRHEKEQVMKELGPKTRRMVFLDQPKRFKKFEESLLKNHTLEELMGEDWQLGDIPTYRREIGEAKVLPAVNYLKDILTTSDEKLVVFAHHIEVVTQLSQYLDIFEPLVIRGGMTAKEKQKRVNAFQTNDKNRIIIGNIDAMGVGNTLTRSPRIVMVEYSFVPGVNEQAEDRIHRLTQEKNVVIDYLIYRNSLDERMLRSAISKDRNIKQIMKGKDT